LFLFVNRFFSLFIYFSEDVRERLKQQRAREQRKKQKEIFFQQLDKRRQRKAELKQRLKE
jgi:hypothetical protein